MITLEDAVRLSETEVRKLSCKHLNKLRVENMNLPYYVHGDGAYLVDDVGNKYLDMTGSIGVQAIGNCNERAINAFKYIMDNKIPAIQAAALHPFAAAFAANLSELSPGSLNHVWFGNCGTEAVEAALKIVNLAHRNNKNKTRIVSCNNAFHGRTLGSLSLMGDTAWQLYNQKEIINHTYIPFDDVSSLERELSKEDVIAFFVEPIQGEAGVIIPHDDYLKKVRELCTKYNTYLVCDEIQSGFGRTGKLWAFENWDIVPDLCTFAKGYSAGYIPVGGCLVTDELWELAYGSEDTFFLHTNTYMEGTMACVAALISLEELINNKWLDENKNKGEYLLNKLNDLKIEYPNIIKEVHGKGLLISILFYSNEDKVPQEIEAYLRQGYFTGIIDDILLNKYHIVGRKAGIKPRIRFLPNYSINYEDIEYFIDSFKKTIDEINNMLK